MDAALLLLECLATAALVLGLFHARRRLGIAPLFVALGGFQMAQVLLAATFYVELAPGWVFSPGSVVLFPAGLFAVLLLYIHDDIGHTRELVYGLITVNITLAVMLQAVSWQMQGPGAFNLLGVPPELFAYSGLNLASGTVLLWIDVLLLIIIFEHMPAVFRQPLVLRVGIALSSVLIFDTLFFVHLNFGLSDAYGQILASSILGKLVATALYSVVLAVYESRVQQPVLDESPAPLRDIFHTLTYRDRYDLLREQVSRDPLTGAYNRRFLREFLPTEVERARRLGQQLSLVMIDLDHFKAINDEYGHVEGDRVLVAVAEELAEGVRGADAVARFGGEEFAVVLPNAGHAAALDVAEALRLRLAALPASTDLAIDELTATLGVATYPADAEIAEELLVLADERLYAGKRAGRDRVVGQHQHHPEPDAARRDRLDSIAPSRRPTVH